MGETPEVRGQEEELARETTDQYSLLDEATGQAELMVSDVGDRREVAADWSRPLEERLDAYEDIVDSEVGDTSLVRARNIEREVGLRQIYLKFEGGNPTGTQKDRIAFVQASDALRRGYDTLTLATCGNYGVAMALACSLAGLKCVIHIPQAYNSRRLEEMVSLGATIVRTAGDYENAVEVSRKTAVDRELYDANPGGDNASLQFLAYGKIAHELYDELRDAPAAVALPVSNGTTLVGLYRGFLSLQRRGKVSRIPRLVAGSSSGKNPIVQSLLKETAVYQDLRPEQIRETSVNEPLINWHSIDGQPAFDAVRKSQGWAGDASDRKMSQSSRLIREKEGLHVLPASTAGLIALVDAHLRAPLPGDRYVVVLTGRKG